MRGGSFALLAARTKPSFQGLGTLAGSMASQHTGDGEVLVKIGPVQVGAVSSYVKVTTLFRCAVPKTVKPAERHDDRPPIHEIARQMAKELMPTLQQIAAYVPARGLQSC